MLLVSDALTIAFRADGQLPLVISFKAVSLFVMSGAGLTLSNFNAEAGECKHSVRDVPIITTISDDSLLGDY